jgi:DNA-directed RNA polymerase subunit RPC12/RpoP
VTFFEKMDNIFDRETRVIPPGSGQGGHFMCNACKNRFTREISGFFGFGVRCPKCGSPLVIRDPWIVN